MAARLAEAAPAWAVFSQAAPITPLPVLFVGQVEQAGIHGEGVGHLPPAVKVEYAITRCFGVIGGLGHVDAGFRRHQGPAQLATKRAARLAVAQAEYTLERVDAVNRLTCALILAAGVSHAAACFPASRQTQLVEEQLAFGFRATNGYAITVDVLELAEGKARHAGGPADLLNKVVVLVVE